MTNKDGSPKKKVVMVRETHNFPLKDFDSAVDLLDSDLRRERTQREREGTA